MATVVKHCPYVQTLYDEAAKIEDQAQRYKAKTAAQRCYAIAWRGLVRGAAVCLLESHGMSVEVRSRGEALPFIRVSSCVDGVTKERDTSLTGVVRLAAELLGTSKAVKDAQSAPTDKTVAKTGVSDLAALLSSRLTGKDITEFSTETREEIECLYTVLRDLCQVS